MKTFKKRYLFPLMLVCGAHQQQVQGRTRPTSWFDQMWSWDLFDDRPEVNLEHELKMLKKHEKKLEESLLRTKQDIENNIKRSEELKLKRNSNGLRLSDSFSIKEKRSGKDEAQEYQVIAHLPGFEEHDLKITTDRKNNQLHISGTKAAETKSEKTKENESGKTASKAYLSEEFVSSQNINGKKRKLKYKNGTIDILVDLPEDITVKDFDTSFENGTLTVSFK